MYLNKKKKKMGAKLKSLWLNYWEINQGCINAKCQ